MEEFHFAIYRDNNALKLFDGRIIRRIYVHTCTSASVLNIQTRYRKTIRLIQYILHTDMVMVQHGACIFVGREV